MKNRLLLAIGGTDLRIPDDRRDTIRTRAPILFDQFSVTVGPKEGNEGTWFRVDFADGRVHEFLAQHVFEPFGIVQYRAQKLLLQTRHQISVVDLDSGKVIDRFARLRVKQSPTGRYLALQRHSPNSAPYYDSVYSVYDLNRSPTENRPPGADSFNAGRLVYPMANVLAQSYYAAKSERDAGALLSEFWWLGDDLLAFVDYHYGVVTLVLIDVGPGVDQVRRSETALDLGTILKPGEAANAQQLKIAKIERLDDARARSLRLTFEPHSFLNVTYTVVRANGFQ